MTEKYVLKVAVIGIGNIGSAHATAIANREIEGMTLTAVCDTNQKKIKDFQKKFSNIEGFSSYESLIDANVCDAVIIATPHPKHCEIGIRAIKSGLHILVEKPIDISVAMAKELNEVASQKDRVFAVMFNQRTNELFIKAREIVKNGLLGELKKSIFEVTNWYRTQSYYDSSGWRATWSGEGGGVLVNQAVHNLDLWQWICGMPVSVSAICDCGKYHNIETEDDATILARYKNGATGVFMSSTGEYPGTNRIEISGTLGKIVLENGVLKWWRLLRDEREVCRNSLEQSSEIEYEYTEIKQEALESAHKGILQNFANAILFSEPLISSGFGAINELEISAAAYLSAWQGGIWVDLPVDSALFQQKLEEKAEMQKFVVIKKQKENTPNSSRWRVNW